MAKLEVSKKLSEKTRKALEAGLDKDSARKKRPPHKVRELVLVQRDSKKKIIAGLYAKIWWDWLYVDMLWVDEKYQRKGVASRLMNRAEKEAKKMGCVGAYVWTQSWQGPKFYPACGYKKFVVMKDFPKGHQRIGFMKRLAA